MARTVTNAGRTLQPLPGSRPDLLRRLMCHPRIPNIPDEQLFETDIDNVTATQIDDNSVVLLTQDHFNDMLDNDLERYEEPDAFSGPQVMTGDLRRVWKATCVYEQLSENHPRIVRFQYRDPFFGVPILDMPSTTVDRLTAKYRSSMYFNADGQTRITPKYRPLIYQWALHLVSALSFVHSKNILFGDLQIELCWLSSSLSLSLLSFLDAVYIDSQTMRKYINGTGRDEPFHPCNIPRRHSQVATVHTDLFLWGCLVYQLMTESWPGHEQDRQDAEMRHMVVEHQWPILEREYLGDIVRKCWECGYVDVEELKRDLDDFLTSKGWEVDGDELCGFQATELFEENSISVR
ncbi:hypothetical protein CNMCM7691_004804 [Aspergillus felis]|uniref:Protein kinase domain-containing protein n=1 Tax=Aspergillus felis TaxID=1287682 RepID=A0A8H6R2W4_9EURO|nr:hypothetical protein CNMCM7691_004804 [Aspergillus felis]